jgi:EAL and modified HD-GYP domain-containing signal transduction protein
MDTIYPTLNRLQNYKLKYLAEKVETYDEFERARKLGFSYFQGYFFTKPEKIGIREVASAKISLVNLLAEVNRDTTSLQRLEEIVSSDAGLSYKLLRFINSSYFYRINKIESINHAVAYLGDKELRRFISLVIISEIASDKPTELVRLALVRAKFLELLMLNSTKKKQSGELFLLGLFSLLDAMLDTDMGTIGVKLPLSDNLRDALVLKSGALAPFLSTLVCYEKRDKPGCLAALKTVGVAPGDVGPAYLEAITFARAILG